MQASDPASQLCKSALDQNQSCEPCEAEIWALPNLTLNPNSALSNAGIGKCVGKEELESSISASKTWLIGSKFWLTGSHFDLISLNSGAARFSPLTFSVYITIKGAFLNINNWLG